MASFFHTIPNPNEMVVCPYDKVHVVAHKKLQYHLMKCRRNHPNARMATCHFNARHVVPEQELRIHLSSCPDRHVIEVYREAEENVNIVKGNTEVPTYFPDYQIDHGECWDDEPAPRRVGVHASDLAGRTYIKDLTGLKPSQRRQYHDNQRRGDHEANIALIESLNLTDEPGKQLSSPAAAASANYDHGATATTSPPSGQMTPPSNPFQPQMSRPAGVGKGRGRLLAAPNGPAVGEASGAAVAVAATTENQDDIRKLIRRTRKKLSQIEKLIERQREGGQLTDEERVKIAGKLQLQNKLANLEAMSQASPQ